MEYFGLSVSQENIWSLQKFYEGTSIGNQCGAIFYENNGRLEFLQEALNEVIRKQTSMRLRFREVDGHIQQYVTEFKREEFEILRFSSSREYKEYAKQFAQTPMEVLDRAMYKIKLIYIEKQQRQAGILMLMHHLIADAWSFGLIAKSVDESYQKLDCGIVDNGEEEYDYREFIKDEENYLSSPKYISDELYWRGKYHEIPENTIIKAGKAQSRSARARRYTMKLPEDLYEKIEEWCKYHKTTPAVLLETVLIIYLKKINDINKTVSIGVLSLNRWSKKQRKMTGTFIATTPFIVEINPSDTINTIIKKVTDEQYNILRHQRYPYSQIVSHVRKDHNIPYPLYNVLFSFQNAKTDTDAFTQWFSNGYSEVPLAIHVDNRDGENTYTLNIDYQIDLFDSQKEIEWIIERLGKVLEQILSNQELTVDSINILPEKEYEKIILEFNNNSVTITDKMCVHSLFEKQATIKPDEIALIFKEKVFTYFELNAMANSLAHYLRAKGVGNDNIVPIMAVRDWRMIVSMIAVLKAGGAFMMVAPDYPKERINYMLKATSAKVCIGDFDVEDLCIFQIDIERFDFNYNIMPIHNINTITDMCYVVFTSGSTGEPKAIVVEHKNVINLCLKNSRNVYSKNISESSHMFLSVTNPIFDMYITESLLPLVNGITILLADDEQCVNQKKLSGLCDLYEPDIFETTPTKMKLLTKDSDYLNFLSYFKSIILGGESFSKELYDAIKNNSEAKIYNNYGPAETTVWSTIKEVGENKAGCDVTVGKPIINTQIYILDNRRNLLPIGVAGELFIAGDGVARGYLNQPEMTENRFLINPFATKENGHGRIMYKTGDLGRWRIDGDVEYLGRVDTQIKIRGLRVELEEIERVMSNYDGIQMSAVTDKVGENGRHYLVGYYMSAIKINEKKLRIFLSDKLPLYMVPNYFMQLDMLPMTRGGKIDRKRLPMPEIISGADEYVAPRKMEEKVLCDILTEILKKRIGIGDNFFDEGGDSLSAIEYMMLSHDEGIDFSLQNIYDYPTVYELCMFLQGDKKKKIQYVESDFYKYESLLSTNVVDDSFIFRKKDIGNILLTGATGFLGAHILAQLVDQDCGTIYCLVRDDQRDTGYARLQKIIRYYFGNKYDLQFGRSIIPVIGNIEEAGLGTNMPHNIQMVIHTAASVKHYGNYDYFYKVNTLGTMHVIDYAKQVRAKLIHISTLSVSGNSLADEFSVYRSMSEKHFYETSFFIGQPLDNVYIRSKFEAERAVYDAMLDGLDAKVIRVGNLTNRSGDYCFQPNYRENAFLTRVKALLEFGVFPDDILPLYVEFSPVDFTAAGVVLIAQYAEKQNVFHLNNNKKLYFECMMKMLLDIGIKMDIVDSDIFYSKIQETIKNPAKKYIYKAFQNDMDEKGRLVYDPNIYVENDFTIWFLNKTGFEWNEVDKKYIEGYVEYFRRLGYIEV